MVSLLLSTGQVDVNAQVSGLAARPAPFLRVLGSASGSGPPFGLHGPLTLSLNLSPVPVCPHLFLPPRLYYLLFSFFASFYQFPE